MLECPKCGHDNDIGRIFCVKCGEKLEISKVGAPSGMKRMGRKAGKGKSAAKIAAFIAGKFFKITLLAMVSATITLVFLPPNFDSRGFSDVNLESYKDKSGQLEEAYTSQNAVALSFTEAELNAKMAQMVKDTIAAEGEVKGPKLESIYISLGDGTVTATVQRKWWHFRLTAQMRCVVQNKDGHWEFKPDGAWIGRLRLPPQLNDKIAEMVFKVVWVNLDAERKWMDSFGTFEVKPLQMNVTTKKADASAPAS